MLGEVGWVREDVDCEYGWIGRVGDVIERFTVMIGGFVM